MFRKELKILLFLSTLILLNSCIDLKDEYPSFEYYSIGNLDTYVNKDNSIDYVLQIRDVSIAGMYSTRNILANEGDNKVRKYHYHKWIDDINSMATDYLIRKFNNANEFNNSVVSTRTMLIPDFILDCKIEEVFIRNSESGKMGENYVEMEVHANLIKLEKGSPKNTVLFSKDYDQKINRKNSSVRNIAPSLDKALDVIGNEILSDVLFNLKEYNAD